MKKNTLLITIFIVVIAFVAYGYYRLFVVPSLPPAIQQPEIVLVGSHEISSSGRALFISGNYAYVGTNTSIIEILNISNPLNPVSVGIVNLLDVRMGEAKALYVSNGYLYAVGSVGIEIFNISNSAKPERVGYYYISSPQRLVGIDNYLFAGTSYGLYIFDISDPTDPVLVKKDSEDFRIDDLFLTDNLIYMIGDSELVEVSPSVFETKDNIRILDVSDRINPVLVGKYKKQMFSLLDDIYIYNDIAYILHHFSPKKGLTIFDASDLTNLALLGDYKLEIDIGTPRGIYVFDKYAYIISNKKMFILDVSDSTKPILIKAIDQNYPYTISGIGKYIYLISSSSEGVPQFQIFEIK